MVALHDLCWNLLFSYLMIHIRKTCGWGGCVVYKSNLEIQTRYTKLALLKSNFILRGRTLQSNHQTIKFYLIRSKNFSGTKGMIITPLRLVILESAL